MILLSLISGLGLGTYLPIDLSIIISVGMILSIISPILSPIVTTFGLGLGIAVTCKNVIKTAFNRKVSKVQDQQPDTDLHTVGNQAAHHASEEFSYFSSTMAFTAFPMYLLSMIQGLYQFLLPVSILALVLKAWVLVTTDTKSAIKYGIIGVLIVAAAFFTISSGNASSVFLYFLTLVSLPQALSKKQDSNPDLSDTHSRTSMPLEAFLYGQSGNGSIITAMVLIQTILWGSGKDILGTIVNSGAGMLLDPHRIAIMCIVAAFVWWFNTVQADNEIAKCIKQLVSNKKPSRLLGMLVNLVSLGFALVTVNPLVVLGMALAGLILNAFVDASKIRAIVVPALLACGVAVG